MRVILLLLLLAGCSIEKRSEPGTNPDTEMDVGGQTQTDSISVQISAPGVAQVGDAVPITLVVRNNRERHIDLSLTGREIAFDIIVMRDSTIVWQRLRNEVVQSIVQLRTLAPLQIFTLSDHWEASEPGTYRIGAEVLTDSKPFQAPPVSITIR